MAFTVNFYKLSKRENSTKRPSGDGNKFSCNIKMPSGVLSPTIEISTSTNMTQYNYCKIAHFQNRYYFVNDWVSDHGLWIAHLNVDALATYKTDILSSEQYVLRSASERNTYIRDSEYLMTSKTTCEFQDIATLDPIFSPTVFRYIFAVSNNGAGAKINGVQYFCENVTNANRIMYRLLNGSSNYWGSDTDISDSVMRNIINPLQYFSEAYILPFAPIDTFTDEVSSLRVGPWTVDNEQSYTVLNPFMTAAGYIWAKDITIELHHHPQTGSNPHGVYLNGFPFTEHYLYAGPFGIIKLDSSLLVDQLSSVEYVDIRVEADFKGYAILTAKTRASTGKPSVILAKAYANVAIPITLTQTKNDTLNWLGSYVGGLISAGSGNYAGAIGTTANAISSVDSILNKPETKGYQGSGLQIFDPWKVQSEFHHVNGASLATSQVGDPLMEVRTLNTLSGYCKIEKPSLSLDCYESEYNMITAHLSGGFFIE